MVEICSIIPQDRERVRRFLAEHWGESCMVLRGEKVEASEAPGFIAWEAGEIIGLITFRLMGEECEILSLDSLRENRGIGTALTQKVICLAREAGLSKVKLITTNDNIRALRFYQRRGFDMAALHHDALKVSREMKPSIPLIGLEGIPLRHEIEFVMEL